MHHCNVEKARQISIISFSLGYLFLPRLFIRVREKEIDRFTIRTMAYDPST